MSSLLAAGSWFSSLLPTLFLPTSIPMQGRGANGNTSADVSEKRALLRSKSLVPSLKLRFGGSKGLQHPHLYDKSSVSDFDKQRRKCALLHRIGRGLGHRGQTCGSGCARSHVLVTKFGSNMKPLVKQRMPICFPRLVSVDTVPSCVDCIMVARAAPSSTVSCYICAVVHVLLGVCPPVTLSVTTSFR